MFSEPAEPRRALAGVCLQALSHRTRSKGGHCMIVKQLKRICLVCGTSWGVHERYETVTALYSVSNTVNPLNKDGDTASLQGLQADWSAWRCPNCGVENFVEEEYFIEEGVEEEKIPAEKTCPVCAENVKIAAVKCRYCGHDFGEQAAGAAAATVDEAIEKSRARQSELRERFIEQEKIQA